MFTKTRGASAALLALAISVGGAVLNSGTDARAADAAAAISARSGYVLTLAEAVAVSEDVAYTLATPEIQVEVEPELEYLAEGVVAVNGGGSGGSYTASAHNGSSAAASSSSSSSSSSGGNDGWYGIFTSALAEAGCSGTGVTSVPGLTFGGRSVVALAGVGIKVNPDYLSYYSAANIRSVAWHECAHILGAASEGVASAYAQSGTGVEYNTGDASYTPSAQDYQVAAELAAPAPAPAPAPEAPAPAEPAPAPSNPVPLTGVTTVITVTGPGTVNG